jgi:hypothetical protein
MSRPFFFVFPASSDHIIEGDNGERFGRAVTTGVETHKVVAIIDNGLNAPIPMRKRGDEVFANEQLRFWVIAHRDLAFSSAVAHLSVAGCADRQATRLSEVAAIGRNRDTQNVKRTR